VTVRLHGARRATREAGGQRILNGVSLQARPGEIVGVIGETGSGKTTLARTIMGLYQPVAGTVELDGAVISALRGRRLRALRRSGRMQLVFQDPLRSLDPDYTVGGLVAEGLVIQGDLDVSERDEAVAEALRIVGLDPAIAGRRPGQISGGQRQRVAIARAVVLGPRLLVCDEPVSALDASSRNYILRILGELRDRLSLAMVVISHDLASLAGIADRVAVLYQGQIVEEGPREAVFAAPRHPYTALLIASAPSVSRARWSFAIPPERLRRDGDLPEAPPAGAGCVFARRCPFATELCRQQAPPPVTVAAGWTAACHHAGTWAVGLTPPRDREPAPVFP
jgi:oligopeptide/dipeptide ABC transporter ATP-binding protein